MPISILKKWYVKLISPYNHDKIIQICRVCWKKSNFLFFFYFTFISFYIMILIFSQKVHTYTHTVNSWLFQNNIAFNTNLILYLYKNTYKKHDEFAPGINNNRIRDSFLLFGSRQNTPRSIYSSAQKDFFDR